MRYLLSGLREHNVTSTYKWSSLFMMIAFVACMFSESNIAYAGISSHPSSVTVAAGGNTSFSTSVTADVIGPIYQWQVSTDGGATFTNISQGGGYANVNMPTMNITNTPCNLSGYRYRCVITSLCEPVLTSNSATLTVTGTPNPTAPTASPATVCSGAASNLSATSAGNFIQWYLTSTGGSPIGGANSGDTYTVNPTVTTTYWAESLSPNLCVSPSRVSVTVTVHGVLSGGTVASSQTICSGGNPANFTQTVAPSGGTGGFTYQWQSSTDNIVFSSTGMPTTSAFASVPAVNVNTYFRRVATNSCGSANSNTITIEVVTNPVVGSHPGNITECVGGSLSMTVTPTGGSGSFTYDWESSTTCAGFVSVGAPSSATYTPPSLVGNIGVTYYRAKITQSGTGCTTIYSSCATATVSAQPGFSTHPANLTICRGGSYLPTVVGSGGTPFSLTYQWQYSADNVSFSNVADGTPAGVTYTGATTSGSFQAATNDATTPPGTYYYRCMVNSSGTSCASAASNSATMTIVADPISPTATKSPNDAGVCVGQTLTLTSITDNGGGSGVCNTEYRYSTDDGATYTAWSGTLASFAAVYPNAGANRNIIEIRKVCNGSGCDNSAATAYSWTVVPDPSITVDPTDATQACFGATTTYSPSVTATGGTPWLTYQWQYSATGAGAWGNVVNATPLGCTYTNQTTATLNISRAGTTPVGQYYYRCIVGAAGGGCDAAVSGNGSFNIVADPTMSAPVLTASTICAGGSSDITSTVSGGSGANTYQWQYNSGSWANVTAGTPAGATYTNATTPTLTAAGMTVAGAYDYRCVVTQAGAGCDPAVSATATLTVVADPNVTVQPVNASICNSGTYNPTITAAGGTPSLTYQWQYSADNITFSTLVNGVPSNATYNNTTSATAFTASGMNVAGNYYYRCLVNAAGNGCTQAVSNSGMVTVSALGVNYGTIAAGNETVCVAGDPANITFSTLPSGGSGTYNYQWYSSPGLVACPGGGSTVGWTLIGGATANSYDPPAGLGANTTYAVTVEPTGSSSCEPIMWANSCRQVTVGSAINSGTLTAGNQTVCVGGDPNNITFSTAPSGGSGTFTYAWYYQDGIVACPSGTSTVGWTSIGATTSSYDPPVGLAANRTYAVQVDPSGTPDCGVATWASTCRQVTVVADPAVTSGPTYANSTICPGVSTTVSVTASGGTPSLTYRWQYSNAGTWENTTNGSPAGATYTNFTSSTMTISGISGAGSYNYRCYITSSGSGCDPIASAGATLTVLGSSGVWTGAVSTAWENASNWCISGGGIPLASTNVTIPSGGNQPTISSAAVCNNITIDAGATLTLSGTNSLTVSGTWTNNGTFSPAAGCGNGTVIFNGTSTISGSTAPTFSSLTIGPGTTTLGANTTVSGQLTVKAGGVLNFGTFSMGTPTCITLENTGGAVGGSITGSGTLTIGANVSVTYSGSGAVSGPATISCDLAMGAATRTYTVADDGVLNADFIMSGAISATGAFGITKAGTGSMSLTGASTYAGITTVSAGRLTYTTIQNVSGGASALGAPATAGNGTIALGAATLRYTGAGNTSNRVINLTGAGTVEASGTAALTLSGGITSTGAQNLTLDGTGTATESGVIANGAGTLTKNGTGGWILSGNNTYTGATTINVGILNIRHANGLGTTAAGTTVVSGAALEVQGTINVPEPITLNGSGISNDGALRNITNNNTCSGGITLASDATIQSDGNILTLATANPCISGAFNLTVQGDGNVTVATPLGIGTGTVTKNGSGSLNYNAVNTYTGLTTVNAGFLVATAAGAVNTINGPLTVSGGTFSFGIRSNNNAGTVTLSSGTITGTSGVLTSTGSFEMESGTVTITTGGFGGAVPLNKTTAGTVTMSGTGHTYTGGVEIDDGTLTITSDNQLGAIPGAPTASKIRFSGIGTLASTTTLTINANRGMAFTTEARFDIGGAANVSYAGIAAGTGGMRKNGTGTLTLSGASTYTGTTTMNAGILTAGSTGAFGNASNLMLNGGTLITGGFNLTFGWLDFTGTPFISLAGSPHTLAFANSNARPWGGALTASNWTGTLCPGGTGTNGKLTFAGGGAPFPSNIALGAAPPPNCLNGIELVGGP